MGFPNDTLYIPSLGFCLLVVSVTQHALRRLPSNVHWPAGLAALALVSGFYLVQTFKRNLDWKDEFALFSSAVAESPESAQMRTSLAQVTCRRGCRLRQSANT